MVNELVFTICILTLRMQTACRFLIIVDSFLKKIIPGSGLATIHHTAVVYNIFNQLSVTSLMRICTHIPFTIVDKCSLHTQSYTDCDSLEVYLCPNSLLKRGTYSWDQLLKLKDPPCYSVNIENCLTHKGC
jgi:hypothetical protein